MPVERAGDHSVTFLGRGGMLVTGVCRWKGAGEME